MYILKYILDWTYMNQWFKDRPIVFLLLALLGYYLVKHIPKWIRKLLKKEAEFDTMQNSLDRIEVDNKTQIVKLDIIGTELNDHVNTVDIHVPKSELVSKDYCEATHRLDLKV